MDYTLLNWNIWVCKSLYLFTLFLFLSLVAEMKKVTIVSDSIAKYVFGIEGVLLQAFRGDTIGRISSRIKSGEVKLNGFDYVIFHVGTNDIGRKSPFDSIISDYGNLIGICRQANPNIKIIMSAILPRPIDHDVTDNIIRRVNGYLNSNMSKPMNFRFIKTFRPFMFGGRVKRELFAKNDGGLHLNSEGTNRLKYYFLRTIASM